MLRLSQPRIAPSPMVRDSFCTTKLGSKYCLIPNPSQLAQAPAGLLNENKRGSNSDKLYPQCGQEKREENNKGSASSLSISATSTKPLLNSTQVSNDSAKRCSIPSLTLKRSTTTSMLCFFFLSNSGVSSKSQIRPLTRTRIKPCARKLSKTCKCSPLRSLITGAKIMYLPSSGSAIIPSTICVMVCASKATLCSGQRGVPTRANSKRR